MQTLKDLKEGTLKGITHLTLKEDLTTFPLEILDLSDTLEHLDLSHNRLTTLPQELKDLKKLKRAFFSYNRLTEVPSCFKDSQHLTMLGLKGNRIERFEEDILPLCMNWLILTDNRLKALPLSIGKLTKLRKFPLAGNQLASLPQEMAACRDLELIRLSANKLTHIPQWLLELPKLSWLAFSGNPCSVVPPIEHEEIDPESLTTQELLGEGASGEIYKGHVKTLNKYVAIKIFKGAVTSDGYAIDEIDATMSAGDHPHLIKVLAKIKGSNPLGLVLELIPKDYENLGFPPDFETCTRDTFKEGTAWDSATVKSVAKGILQAISHLHTKGLMHGDLYAHNILRDSRTNHVYLGDFGAATFYDPSHKSFEKIEVRAFGCLLEDMLTYCDDKVSPSYQQLAQISQSCMDENLHRRPSFNQILI